MADPDYFKGCNDEEGIGELSNNNDERRDQVLPKDSYVFIHLCPFWSMAHTVALVIFIIQIMILIFFVHSKLAANESDPALYEEFKFEDGNPLKIPLRVSPYVTVCQMLALFITWLDNLERLSRFVHLFLPTHFENQPLENFSFSRSKYIFSHFLRLAMSVMVVMTSLLIIVQSVDVVQLFLDFVAVTFVGYLDTTTYILIKNGVLSERLKRLVKKTEEIKIKMKSKNEYERTTMFLLIIAIITFVGLGALMGWAKWLQYHNVFQMFNCQNFELNIGDNQEITTFRYGRVFAKAKEDNANYSSTIDGLDEKFIIDYRHFDGRYTSLDKEKKLRPLIRNRPVYYQEGRYNYESSKPVGKISYCRGSRRWVFTIPGITKGVQRDVGGCDWLMRSAETRSYTLEEVSMDKWEIWSGPHTGLIQPIKDSSFLTCLQCKDDTDCNYHGKCEPDYLSKKKCVCESPWNGHKCNTCSACKVQQYTIGDDTDELPIYKEGGMEVEIYDRAVYTSERDHDDIVPNSSVRYVVLYTGSRFLAGIFTTNAESMCELRSGIRDECRRFPCCKYNQVSGECSLEDETCNGYDSDTQGIEEIAFVDFMAKYHSAWESPLFLKFFESEYTTIGHPASQLKWNYVYPELKPLEEGESYDRRLEDTDIVVDHHDENITDHMYYNYTSFQDDDYFSWYYDDYFLEDDNFNNEKDDVFKMECVTKNNNTKRERGEQACENKNFTEGECFNMGCCQWDRSGSQCWSNVGNRYCDGGGEGAAAKEICE